MKCSNSLLESRLKQKDQASQNEKKIAWEKIQNTDPTLAKFMTDFNRVFGKPAAIKVELNGETVLNQGTFAEHKKYYDGKMRSWR